MALPINGYIPFKSWNRVESRPRTRDFSKALSAEIHDPLWYLGRQWQMGEFKGNDTGSGIIAKSVMEYSRVYALSKKDDLVNIKAQNFESAPLESMVENVSYNFSLKENIKLSQVWKRKIEKEFVALPGVATAIFTALAGTATFLIETEEPNVGSSDLEKIINSKKFAIEKTAKFIKSAAWRGEILNGSILFEKSSGATPFVDFDLELSGGLTSISGMNQTFFDNACDNFAIWVNEMYSFNSQIAGEFWNKEKLEYEADIYTDDSKRLTAEDAHNGSLDWYSFEDNDTTGASFPTASNPVAAPIVKEMLMTENRFSGMPSTRWWEFENGRVNFCNLNADTTDIAKIMLTQFALVYQDDWFLIPFKLPVGSYSKMAGIVVTDVFGVKTFVANHTEEYDAQSSKFIYTLDTWKEWSWMDIHKKDDVITSQKPTGRMLLLPTVVKKLESKPIESVTFMRDEMSNLVWAIEKIVPNYLGQGVDAQNLSSDYVNYLKSVASIQTSTSSSGSETNLDYELMNTVPENWIPFIVKHVGFNNRDIQLQRASMPRILEGYDPAVVRPRTDLLSYGLENGPPVVGYKINEEEVSRAGTKIETTFQRVRWYNGKTVLWVGRNRTTGRGQGNSGLAFDTVNNNEAED